MARPAQIAGMAPVGFLALAIAAAVATVAGGWTARDHAPGQGYGVTPDSIAAAQRDAALQPHPVSLDVH